jgi:hypothetical protein
MNSGYPRYVPGVFTRLGLSCAVLLLLTACGGASPAGPGRTTGSSGFTGTVKISPAQNTCPATRSCAKAAVGLTLEFSQYGHVVVTTKTGKDGSYKVGVPKGGRYVISVRGHGGVAPTVKPPTANVSEGQFKQLDLLLDVGIR